MSILVITRECWANNSIGNTMTTFFADISREKEIINLFFRESQPDNTIAKETFRISEKQIIDGIRFGKKHCGEYVKKESVNSNAQAEKKVYSASKKIHSYVPKLIRELLWSFPVWKNENFTSFLKNSNIDVVFMPVFPCWYAFKVLLFIKKTLPGVRILLFHADDCYSLRQFSLLPSFWIYRFVLRKWIRKAVYQSDVNYVISQKQKEEYDSLFHFQSKILTKFDDFSNGPVVNIKHDSIRMLYTGNLSLNRWKTLSYLSCAIKNINDNTNRRIVLDIYSGSELSSKQIMSFTNSFCFFRGSVSGERIKELQNNADVLVHVEPFDRRYKTQVRLSFSTKIVDYMHSGHAILAFGPAEVASIDYFIKNNYPFVCISKPDMLSKLKEVADNPEIINTFADKAFACGKKNHNKQVLLKMLEQDIENT